MTQIKIYAIINCSDDLYDGNNYNGSIEYIEEKIQEIADGFEGSVEDLKIK